MQDSMTQFPDDALPEDAQVDTGQDEFGEVDGVPFDDEAADVVAADIAPADEVQTAAPEPPPVRVLPLDRTLAFNHCQTYAMFLLEQEDQGRLLTQRYAETRLLPAVQDAMAHYPDILSILALVDGEDPDTVAVLPIITRLVDSAPRIQLRVLADEDDLTALAMLLPDLDVDAALEEWDLPQFLIFDEDWELQGQWGPRPAAVERNLEAWLSRYPDYEALAEDESEAGLARFAELTEKLVQEMRIWYNSGSSANCQTEFCDMLTSLQAPDEAGEVER
ncbi:MAG: thioredoxin family protein [Caldilinea sp.]|nr:thioredoxin family protein [Caldilinea sp.]MCB0057846.1 thioredoxin family protein [Caldilineaceae bacterium]MCB0150394.1 thioredoxin family protein [Caldilineaceae bacterium]MCB9117056.1 thioredoxin family protein [Caldilineaceae bacterium]MCB9125891.1 thioredoxin family protein [Caldilineaceae bacterium]